MRAALPIADPVGERGEADGIGREIHPGRAQRGEPGFGVPDQTFAVEGSRALGELAAAGQVGGHQSSQLGVPRALGEILAPGGRPQDVDDRVVRGRLAPPTLLEVDPQGLTEVGLTERAQARQRQHGAAQVGQPALRGESNAPDIGAPGPHRRAHGLQVGADRRQRAPYRRIIRPGRAHVRHPEAGPAVVGQRRQVFPFAGRQGQQLIAKQRTIRPGVIQGTEVEPELRG